MIAVPAGTLWRIEVRAPAAAAPAMASALEGACAAVSYFEGPGDHWRIEGYADTPPDEQAIADGLSMTAEALGIALPALSIELLTPRDWLAENLASFEPKRIGRIFVHPGHFEGRAPAGALPLEIDAATAFGSGAHPTTAGCIQAIQDAMRPGGVRGGIRRVLDMGCGSGLLAFVAARLGAPHVVAVDIDPEAVRVARLNARINRLGQRVRLACGPGYRTSAVGEATPYDLIVANVLARPLKAMAGDLARHLAPGGSAILSGLIVRDAADVAQAHRARGLRFVRRIVIEDWATLILEKPGRRAA